MINGYALFFTIIDSQIKVKLVISFGIKTYYVCDI